MHARGSGEAARRAKRGRQPEKKKEIFLLEKKKKKPLLIRLTARFLKTQTVEYFIILPHLIQPLIRNLENQNACDMSFWLAK